MPWCGPRPKLWWPRRENRCSHSAASSCEADHDNSEPGQLRGDVDRVMCGKWSRTQLSSCGQPMTARPNLSLRQPFFPRPKTLVWLLRLGILAASVSAVAAQTEPQRWCNADTEPDNPLTEICFEPSVGPMAGGVMVTVKGMQRAANMQAPLADWRSKCDDVSWWLCTFAQPSGNFAPPVRANRSSCAYNFIVCEAPGQTMSGDVFVTVSTKDNGYVLPSPSGNKGVFSYYGTLPPQYITCAMHVVFCVFILSWPYRRLQDRAYLWCRRDAPSSGYHSFKPQGGRRVLELQVHSHWPWMEQEQSFAAHPRSRFQNGDKVSHLWHSR